MKVERMITVYQFDDGKFDVVNSRTMEEGRLDIMDINSTEAAIAVLEWLGLDSPEIFAHLP